MLPSTDKRTPARRGLVGGAVHLNRTMHESEAIPQFPPPLHVHLTLSFLSSRIDRHILHHIILSARTLQSQSRRGLLPTGSRRRRRGSTYRLRLWALPPGQPVGDIALSRGGRRCWLERAWLTRIMLQTIFCIEYHMKRTEVSALLQ